MPHKILVVDDSATMRASLRYILLEAGYEVDEASDGTGALQVLKPEHGLILLDYNMPGLSGIEVCSRIRQGSVQPHIPIILVTTELDGKNKEAAKNVGATGWLNKPFEPETLLRVVERFAPKQEV